VSVLAPEVVEETTDAPAPVCSPSREAALKQDRFERLAYRIQKSGAVSEDEAMLLWDASRGMWDDAIHVAAPWEPRSSLCGNWGRNLVAIDEARPDGMAGCWTCLIAAEWIDKRVAEAPASEAERR
jgi:hypothetical protein